MRSLFEKTPEELRAWLERFGDEPDCGLLACSPEIYAEMQRKSAEALEKYFKRSLAEKSE
jgi:hypothetical protein